MGNPSISATKSVTGSMLVLAQARRCASVAPYQGGVSKSEHSVFMIGKKRALPCGTMQLRTSGFAAGQNGPPRNQTGPSCPVLQSAVSVRGLWSAGNEMAHCHHRALHSP